MPFDADVVKASPVSSVSFEPLDGVGTRDRAGQGLERREPAEYIKNRSSGGVRLNAVPGGQ